MKKVMLVLCVLLFGIDAQAKIVGSAKKDGKKWYIDVLVSKKNATIWLRVKPDMCSIGDIKYMNVTASLSTLGKAGKMICRAKKVYDSGKTIVGCASTVGSLVCGAASASTAGSAAAVCSGVIVYTVNKGLADCVDGLSSAIASALGGEKEWAIVATQASITSGQWTKAIDKAIDIACSDLKNK